MTELTELKSLYLGKTHIKELPKKMSRLSKLEHLAIWETDLKELPDWICTLDRLKGLFLGRVKGIECLPKNFGNLKNLQELPLFCTRYKNFISDYFYPYPLQSIVEREKYAEIKMFDAVLLRNDKETIVTHILVNLRG